jgi:hypothetical protein
VLLDDIASYLATNGAGTVGTSLFKGYAPESPDACVSVYETQGLAPVRGMSPTAGAMLCERPSLQVVVRAGQYDYSAARLAANDIFRLLDGLGDVDINGVRYLWVAAKQSPFLMGRDESGRVRVVCNYYVVKQLSTG